MFESNIVLMLAFGGGGGCIIEEAIYTSTDI